MGFLRDKFIVPFLLFGVLLSQTGNAERRRFRNEQYAALPALALGNLLLLDAPPPDTAHWKGGILFDDSVRNALRLESRGARDAVSFTGDILLAGLASYPFLVDAVWDRWMQNHDDDTAGQISLMATQAYLFSGLLRLISKVGVGRERPFQRECGLDPNYDKDCNLEGSRASFFSGHAALSFTGAGLICATHESLPLGGGMTPCYVALGVASGITLTRILADKHYISDSLFGVAVGLFSGYFLPKWLNLSGGDPSSQVFVAPLSEKGGIGVQYAGLF